jgi:hypothetical protein
VALLLMQGPNQWDYFTCTHVSMAAMKMSSHIVECLLLVVYVCVAGDLLQVNMNVHVRTCMNVECVLTWIYVYFRWLKQEYKMSFPLDKQPPVHMLIAYGLVDIQKTTTSEKTRPRSQVISRDRNARVHGTDVVNIGFQGNSSCGETPKERQCSLCYSNSEVRLHACRIHRSAVLWNIVQGGAHVGRDLCIVKPLITDSLRSRQPDKSYAPPPLRLLLPYKNIHLEPLIADTSPTMDSLPLPQGH